MQIPLRKEQNKETKIRIVEKDLKKLVRQIIAEELGSFDKQINVGQFCAEKALNMLEQKKKIEIFKIENCKDISFIQITIIDGYTTYQCIGFDKDNKTILIEIGKYNLIDKEHIESLASSISHELMHGNIFVNRALNNLNINDQPNYYEKLFNILRSESCGDIIYNFAYGLYITYYQEVNAFISQVSSQILELYAKLDNKNITNKEFKQLYANTNTVIAFKQCQIYAEKILNSNDNFIQNNIIDEFEKYTGINLTIQKVKKYCTNIIRICQEALKDCERNSMIAFEIINK